MARGKGELGRACQGEARKMGQKDTVRHPGVRSDLEVLTVKLVSPKLLEYLKECLKEEK